MRLPIASGASGAGKYNFSYLAILRGGDAQLLHRLVIALTGSSLILARSARQANESDGNERPTLTTRWRRFWEAAV